MKRRAFLLTPLGMYAQGARPSLAIQWISGGIPSAFAREAMVFSRAYTCCPDRERAQWALEHGRFPHSEQPADASLWDYFERAEPESADIVVMTAHSGDGNDTPRERSVHVPLAIRWPGKVAQRTVNELASHADVFPSLLALAGIAAPSGLHGRDLRGAVPDSVYIEGGLGTPGEWRALVRGFDKLIWNLEEEILGLYNVIDDPNEQHDLREEREGRLMRDSMWALARQWMDRVGDGRDEHGLRTRRPA